MKKVKRNLKLLLEESRGMAVTQTKDPQTVEGEWIFSGKIHYFELQVYKVPAYETQLWQNHLLSEFSIW